VLALAALTACHSSDGSHDTADDLTPQLVMSGPTTGYAAWPSGGAWVVLHTTDGWATVVNRTPLAVPTDGGLRIAVGPGRVAVGVLTHEYLKVSPVLVSDADGSRWIPSQLPGELAAGPWSLARSGHATWAVLADSHAVVVHADSAQRWRTAPGSRSLGPADGFTPQGIVFPSPATGFLLGESEDGGSPLFVTTDAGQSWRAVAAPKPAADGRQSLLVCRLADTWAAVVLDGERLQLLTTTRIQRPWTIGPSLPWTGDQTPVVACGPTGVFAVTPQDSGQHLQMAVPGANSWQDKGLLPAAVYSLAVPDRSHAYAATDNGQALLEVGLGAATTRWLPLPAWVSSLAASDEDGQHP